MIELTGTLKGKTYNQEVVSPDLFAELVGAPPKRKANEEHILEICPNLVKTTPEGQINYPRGIMQQGMTSLTIDGDTVNVRFYKQKNQTAPGMFKYTPSHIEFKGLKNAYTTTNYEEFLFMYVSPLCKNSPSASMDPMIQYHDVDAIERAAISKNEGLERMLEIIQNAPPTDIIAKSRGMTVRGHSTNVPQDAKVGLHRSALIALLVKFQEDFEQEWISDSVMVRGLAKEAMYRGAIKQQDVNGRAAWVWSSNGNVILFIAPGADPFTELVAWAVSAENTEYAKNALTLAVSGQEQKAPVLHPNTPPKTEGEVSETRAMLELAAKKGMVWREDGTNRIMYQGPQGPVETRSFSGEDWIGNLETFLRTVGKQAHLAAIKAALKNQ